MRKFIVLMLLAIVSGSAAAEWVKVGSSGSGKDSHDIYVLPAYTFIRKADRTVKMWHMLDFKTEQVSPLGAQFLSAKVMHEFDCKDNRLRLLFYTVLSANMGTGKVVYSYDGTPPSDWTSFPPETLAETLWTAACRKQ
jgi:hypothetical protein